MQYSIKELRARKGLTQAEVAKLLGVSTQTYNTWERNLAKVSIGKVKAMADIFGVKLSDIFFTEQHEINSCKKTNKQERRASCK